LDENDRVQHIKTTNFPLKESVYGFKSRFNHLVYDKVMNIFRPKKKRKKKKSGNGKNKAN
jgi:hypothetical protein